MRKPFNLQPREPISPRASDVVPTVVLQEDRIRGGTGDIIANAPAEIRAACDDLVPARWSVGRPRRRPVTAGGSKAPANAAAGPCSAAWEFLEYEQGGGI
jgi:hypothetical protein